MWMTAERWMCKSAEWNINHGNFSLYIWKKKTLEFVHKDVKHGKDLAFCGFRPRKIFHFLLMTGVQDSWPENWLFWKKKAKICPFCIVWIIDSRNTDKWCSWDFCFGPKALLKKYIFGMKNYYCKWHRFWWGTRGLNGIESVLMRWWV